MSVCLPVFLTREKHLGVCVDCRHYEQPEICHGEEQQAHVSSPTAERGVLQRIHVEIHPVLENGGAEGVVGVAEEPTHGELCSSNHVQVLSYAIHPQEESVASQAT